MIFIDMKKCNKCNETKPIIDFVSGKLICKKCWSIDRKIYYQKNKEKILKKQLENYHTNNTKSKERYKLNREVFKLKNAEYYKQNKITINKKKEATHKKRFETDVLYRLIYRLRRNISGSIRGKGYTKKAKTTDILGCSFEVFKTHLESKFEPWMNWDNHGKYNGTFNYGWDLDHIIPISSADNEIGIMKLNHYTNFQPLCSKINRDIKKGLY